MALAKIKEDQFPSSSPSSRVTAQVDGAAAIASPARALQDRIERHARIGAGADLDKWSPRRTLAFIVVTSAALWMALIAGAAQAVHLLA